MAFGNPLNKIFGSENNFKYLDKLIHSGKKEIVLQSDITLNDKEHSKYNEGIKIDLDDIVIDGNGHTIDACEKSRIFLCTGKNVTIKNITLKNGIGKDGGAIENLGELCIIKSTLTQNRANGDSELSTGLRKKSGKGGAINNQGKLSVIGSNLNQNTANSGGAIYNNNDSELKIIKSILIQNTTKEGGGAVYNKSKLRIIESELNQNTAKYGGAIDNDGQVEISKSTLKKNIIEGKFVGGGAIINHEELEIIESTLSQNMAKGKYVSGGAIENKGNLTITKSTLSENSAEINGGAINNSKNLKILDCEISDNKSSTNVICNDDSLQIDDGSFINNHAPNIILNSEKGHHLDISNGKFIENDFNESIILNEGNSCTIEKSIFDKNLSDTSSHIIANKTDLTVINLELNNNETILNEGYLLVKRSSPDVFAKIEGNGEVEDDTIPDEEKFDFTILDGIISQSNEKEINLDQDFCLENYEIDYYEGGIELGIDDLVINGNGHTIDGASKSRIFTVTGNNITLKNIIFKNGHSHKNYDNPLNNHGGAIKTNMNSKLTIENCEFISNLSEENGGAIYSVGELNITKAILNQNTAEENGGAIYSIGKLRISETKLNQNTAKNGGAITNQGERQDINPFIINTFAKNGGAIRNQGELSIFKSEINQKKKKSGGAIYINYSVSNINESTLDENTSNYGGAIFTKESDLNIIKSTINENQMEEGTIYNLLGNLTITESTLEKNTAKHNSGAIYNNEGNLTIEESFLNQNMAEKIGGAINNRKKAKSTIKNSTLNKNVSNKHGGAINNEGILIIEKATINENTSHGGGAIFNQYDGNITIIESQLKDNTAETHGEAIWNNGALRISKSILFTIESGLIHDTIYNTSNGKLTIDDYNYNDHDYIPNISK